MTKKTQKESKPSGKRKKTKYPNLAKDCNLKVRREYIDTYYTEGIKNKNGEYVIRPLTDEEKQWLDTFYGEHVGASFCEKNSVHQLLSAEESVKLKKNLKEAKKELANIQKEINEKKTGINELVDDIEKLKKSEVKLVKKLEKAEEAMKADHKKASYDANNARNRCLYNQSRKTGKLIKFKKDEYERMVIDKLGDQDLELLIVDDKDLLGE